MKVIVTFSGGKDSLASLLWVRNNITKDFTTVFCDTGWEHPLTYKYIEEIRQKLDLNLVTLKSKKFNGMVDLARKKTRWPSSQRRFCTSELKTIPMIDYVLDEVRDDMLMIQGIRAAESARRHSDIENFKEFTEAHDSTAFTYAFNDFIKGSVEDELADVVIRCLDLAALRGIEFRYADMLLSEGVKEVQVPFSELMYLACEEITDNGCDLTERLNLLVAGIIAYGNQKGIDLEWHIRTKMEYNRRRGYHHGGKRY